jgi:FKBP-type peptidyl-prolyl cis-trans isomerase SlyD
MKKTRVVVFHYTLTDSEGTEIDSSRGGDPLAILEGAGNIIPGLEVELKKLASGDKKKINVAAKDAYGEKNSDMVMEVPLTQFPSDVKIKVGDRFRTSDDHYSPVFCVMKVTDSHVTIDGNHPLAGKDLTFDVEITEIRDASDEELAHGHVHGPGGHHHH